MRLWSTDKGVCPTCKPEENRAVYGLAPLAKVVEQVREPKRTLVRPLTQMVETQEDVSLASIVKAHILKVYEENGRNKLRASKKLGISNRTLYNHLDMYGVM
jgi:transcriptional regulator with PAS, ATPase and Fis domain